MWYVSSGVTISLEPGAIFATDFRIVRPLDAGGMGAIYVVEQLSTGNQRALKLMHAQLLSDPKLRERFLQEARVGSKIASDHVVQVIAAGVDTAHNVPWLVMELLQGEELEARVKREGPLPPREVAEIVKQLGHALAAAHAVGVVHRDLKPNNLFLCRPRAAGSAFLLKVLDFGIAKIVAEAQTSGTSGLGTPLWMAPEQTESRSHVGPGTDIWALGLLAFWMLTGQVYWASAMAGSTSVHAVLREMLMEPIVPPSIRAGDRGRAQLLPPGFDAWFLHCVERSLERRLASVDEAVRELLVILEDRGSRAHTEAPIRAQKTVASSPLSAAMEGSGYQGQPSMQLPQGGHPHPSGSPGQSSWTGSPQPSHGQSSAATPAGFVTPGYSSPGPAPASPRRSSGGLVVGIIFGALALAGAGGAVAYFKWSADQERHQARRHSDDDDDEPRKKDKDTETNDEDATVSKADQCNQVIASLNKAKAEFDANSTVPNPGSPKMREVAVSFDSVAESTSSVSLTDVELKKDVEEYATMARDAARAARALADATDSRNASAMLKSEADLESATSREPPIFAAINLYCGRTTP